MLILFYLQARLGYVCRSQLPTAQRKLNAVLKPLLMLEKRKELFSYYMGDVNFVLHGYKM